jgi:CBS domain-containing protein
MPATVRDLMAPAVVSVGPDDTIETARSLMHAHDVHALPVVGEQEEPVGILTSTDLAVDLPSTLPVARVMTRALVEIASDAAPETAARTMTERHIHHLVVTDQRRLVGVLSALDLLHLVRPSRPRTKRK